MTHVIAHHSWVNSAYRLISKHRRGPRSSSGVTAREAIWRHLVVHPQRDDIDTLLAVAAADGIEINANTAYATRSRWRDTLRLLAEAGVQIPG